MYQLFIPIAHSPYLVDKGSRTKVLVCIIACNSCKTLIGVHEMHGRMHPN